MELVFQCGQLWVDSFGTPAYDSYGCHKVRRLIPRKRDRGNRSGVNLRIEPGVGSALSTRTRQLTSEAVERVKSAKAGTDLFLCRFFEREVERCKQLLRALARAARVRCYLKRIGTAPIAHVYLAVSCTNSVRLPRSNLRTPETASTGNDGDNRRTASCVSRTTRQA